LGSSPFTIWIDATFTPADGSTEFIISQGASQTAEDFDFYIQQFLGPDNSAAFYNGEGQGHYVRFGTFDGARHQVALTWDGATFGLFFDDTLQTRSVTGSLPDIDGSVLRFGATEKGSPGSLGTYHEIRIYDHALSEAELAELGSSGQPDLVVQDLEVIDHATYDIAYRYTIKNVGDGPANLDGPTGVNSDNVSVQAFVSTDTVFNNGNDLAAGGTIVGVSPLGNLEPGETLTGTFGCSVSFDPQVHRYLVLKVDWGEVVDESDEENNTLAVVITNDAPVGLVGHYPFEDGTADNAITGVGALPDLVSSGCAVTAGNAVLDSGLDYLELPVSLGASPFTIWIDATYEQSAGHASIVSQGLPTPDNRENWDFLVSQFVIAGVSPNRLRTVYYGAWAQFNSIDTGIGLMDGSRRRVALTWDGSEMGAFFDGSLQTRTATGWPDIDGTAVRFGASEFGGSASKGRIHEIRIYDRALSEAELSELGSSGQPDLIVQDLEVIEHATYDIAYRYTIKNVGDGPAYLDGPTGVDSDNVSVQAFVSTDTVFNNGNDLAAGGTIVGVSPLGNLEPGETLTGTFGCSVSFDPQVHRYLVLKVDWGEVVEESDESNNTTSCLVEPSSSLVILSAASTSASLPTESTYPSSTVDKISDQSGLSIGFSSGVSGFDEYASQQPVHGASPDTVYSSENDYFGNGVDFDFDLGGVYEVHKLAFWNGNVNAWMNPATGIKDFRLLASLDAAFDTPIDLGNHTLSAEAAGDPTPIQVLTLSAAVNARYVRVEALSNHGNPGHYSLSEVAFGVEPASGGPDLIVQDLEVIDHATYDIAYRYTIKNVGDGPANLDGPTGVNSDNVSVQAFVSTDTVFNNGNDVAAGGTIVGVSPLGNLEPGETLTGTFGASASFDPQVHRYLVLKVDWGEVVDESDEDNNTLAVAITNDAPVGLVGHYPFEDGTADNAITGPGALPDLVSSGCAVTAGDAVVDSGLDYLELPVALGSSPFTIWLDATLSPADGGTEFIIAQGASQTAENFDFYLQQFLGPDNSAAFYNGEGQGHFIAFGTFDGARHQVALTWDGATFGLFFDHALQTRSLSGTVPDIDGSVLRFGGTQAGSLGSLGAYHEIRIYDRALSEAELAALGTSGQPDLIVQELEVIDHATYDIAYRYTIKNVGDGPANLDGPTGVNSDNVSVQAFVSTDTVFNNGNDLAAGGTIVGLSPLGPLAPGETLTGTFGATVSFDPEVHKHLVLKVDWGGVVEESDESNNTASCTVDDDGTPNDWEYFHFGTAARDCTVTDGDLDGFLDQHEYIAGTLPMDGGDFFRIEFATAGPEQHQSALGGYVAMDAGASTDMTIHWKSVSNRIYTVYSCTNLQSVSWTNVHETAGDGSVQSYTEDGGEGQVRFYRLGVRLADD